MPDWKFSEGGREDKIGLHSGSLHEKGWKPLC